MILTNRLFNDVLTNWDKAFFDGDYSYWRRDNNVRSKELEDSYEYYVPLPGFKKEDIKATIHDGQAYLVAKKGEDVASYSFFVPDDVDLTKQSARHEDGLLTIKLNKKESAKAIEINIK